MPAFGKSRSLGIPRIEPPPRDDRGRVQKRYCPDPNCGGAMVYAPYALSMSWTGLWLHYWHCDGLTHETPHGPLIACGHDVTGSTFRCEGEAHDTTRKASRSR